MPIASYFIEHGYGVIGIDISSQMIALAKASLPNGKFFVADMNTVDFPANSFDIIVSFFSIIHVPREEHPQIIASIYRMLKPNGSLLITMGMEDSAVELKEDWKGAPMFWSHFDHHVNERMLIDSGFKIELSEATGKREDEHWLFRCSKGDNPS